MAISVDDSTVALVGGTTNNTTSAFTPANTSLLVVGMLSSGELTTFTISGGGLTWNKKTAQGDTFGDGTAQMATALVSTGASMTVNVTSSGGHLNWFKVYIVQGHDTSTPVGNEGGARGVASNPASLSLYTSSVDNSRGFYCGVDWIQLGTPTSTDTEVTFDSPGNVSGLVAYKAADTATSGTGVTGQYDAPAGTPNISWAAIEIKPAAGGGGGVSVTSQSGLGFVGGLGGGLHRPKPPGRRGFVDFGRRAASGLYVPERLAA